MKPREMRERRLAQEAAREARGERLEEFLLSGGGTEKVVPDLIPTEGDLRAALREYRHAARVWAGARGVKRAQLGDGVVFALARIVFIERVLALDPLERAALTPARLVMLSRIHPDELQERLDRFQGREAVQG